MAHYDLPQIPIQEFFEYALRCDPVFKIQSIPEDQLYLKDEKLKFTRFEYMSSVYIPQNKKKWLEYKILRPSSNPEKKYYREGPISCLKKPLRRTKRLAIEKLKENFKGAILIIPVILSMINTSKIKLKRFDINGYFLRVRSNNNGSKEEQQISNSELGRSQTKRPPCIKWLNFTERLIVFSSLKSANTMPLSALNEHTKSLNERVDKRKFSDPLITELSALNEHTKSLNERVDKRKFSDPLITESPKKPKLNNSVLKPKPIRTITGETSEHNNYCYTFSAEEIAIVDNILKEYQKDEPLEIPKLKNTHHQRTQCSYTPEEVDSLIESCIKRFNFLASALNKEPKNLYEKADISLEVSEALTTEASALNKEPKNLYEKADISLEVSEALTTEASALNEEPKNLYEKADISLEVSEALTTEASALNEEPKNLYEKADISLEVSEALTTEATALNKEPKNLYEKADISLEVSEALTTEATALNKEPKNLYEKADISLEVSEALTTESPINPSNALMENQLPELLHSPSAASTLNGSFSEESPKRSPSYTTMNQQPPELSHSASFKFDVSFSAGPPKSLSFSVIEKKLPESLQSPSTSKTSYGSIYLENGDSNTSDKSKKVRDAVNMVLENIQGKINEAVSTKLNIPHFTETDYVTKLKTYLESRSLIDATYSISSFESDTCDDPTECRYVCSVKLLDKTIGSSFPIECTSSEEAMQVAAKIAFDYIQICDYFSLHFFFNLQSLF